MMLVNAILCALHRYIIALIGSHLEFLPIAIDNDSSSSSISRGVYMTDASVCPTEDNRDHVTLMSLPSKTSENPHPTSVLELGHTSMVTPKGLFLVHLTKQGSDNYEADLKEAEEALFHKQSEGKNYYWFVE